MRTSYLVLTSLYIYEHKRHGSWDKKSRTYSTATTPVFNSKTLYSFDSVKSLTHIFFICISMPLFNHMLIFSSGYILLYTKFDSFVGLSKWMWKLEVYVLEFDFYFLFYILSVIVIEQWVLYSEETYIGHFDIALIWMFYELIHLLFFIKRKRKFLDNLTWIIR